MKTIIKLLKVSLELSEELFQGRVCEYADIHPSTQNIKKTIFISNDRKPITAIVGFCSIKVPLAPSNTIPILICSRQQYSKTALTIATKPTMKVRTH